LPERAIEHGHIPDRIGLDLIDSEGGPDLVTAAAVA
jgi:hypothetical protein